MSTLGTIATWAVGLLNREELVGKAVLYARDSYITICSRVPFDVLRAKTVERNMVAAPEQDISDIEMCGIVSVRATCGTLRRRLRRRDVRQFDAVSYTTPGTPVAYGRYGSKLEFFPTPASTTYTYRIRYWQYPPVDIATPDPDVVSSVVLITPPEWDELLKWETLYRLYHHIGQEDKAMMLVAPSMLPRQPSPQKTIMVESGIIPRLWNDLLRDKYQRESIDEDFGLTPVMRRTTRG